MFAISSIADASDFLLILVRRLLATRSDVRLVLMSAAFNTDVFTAYFGGCPRLHVPGFMYPVDEGFLEDALHAVGFRPAPAAAVVPI